MDELLRNPYDFVPFEGSPRHDFKANGQHATTEGLTGEIACELTVLTPLFVGTGQRIEQGRQALFHPAVVRDEPYIPAKSLKGMVRSVVETASNSCMGALSEEYPRIRILGTRRVPPGYSPCTSVRGLCLACAMFGMVEAGDGTGEESKVALAGRVWLSDAHLSSGRSGKFQEVELPGRFNKREGTIAPIGSPKPAHETFYFSENGQCLGRKFYYRTRLWSDTLRRYQTAYRQAFGEDYRMIVLETVPVGATFAFKARFLSLSEGELDHLLYGLCLEDGMCHHLGYGKPFGLGSVKIEAKSVRVLRSESESKGPALYLYYDLTQSGPEAFQIWDTLDREGYEVRVWDRGQPAQQVHQKLADILKWPRDEVFFYPDFTWFRHTEGSGNITLAEYQQGVRSKPITTSPRPPRGPTPTGPRPPRETAPSPSDRRRGRVQRFDPDSSYGFIEVPGQQRGLFVHINNVRGKVRLRPGQEVEYSIGSGPKGDQAVDVQPL
ncbi:MAG: RAMP superfamily CRISPR-associated protein [Anaerolineae bacterium]|nr:RAMP superfamily CRISPR-associated protein [Anaerolineae bacterium]